MIDMDEIKPYSSKLKPTVLCYIQKNGKTLMLHKMKNDFQHNKWNGLGGKMEHNESPEDAVKREVFEESGLILKKPILKGIITYPQTNNDDYCIAFIFTAKQFSGQLIESREGKPEWIKTTQLKKLNMWQGDKYFLHLLNKKGIFTGKITYDGEKVIKAEMEKY